MEDFKLEIELKVTVKPVTPKTGFDKRGPYERNLNVITEKASAFYVGAKSDIATMAANALLPLTRKWGLLTTVPAQGYTLEPIDSGATSALLRGMVHDHNTSTAVTFEFGTTKDLGTSTAATQSPLTGNAWHSVTLSKTGLTEGTQYYYRIKMVSGGVTIYSDLRSFVCGSSGTTTTAAPTTTAATTTAAPTTTL